MEELKSNFGTEMSTVNNKLNSIIDEIGHLKLSKKR